MSLHNLETEFGAYLNPPPGQSQSDLAEALAALKSGGVVALPTDTLYGLAVDITNEQALERIFEIKGRPANLALPVLVADWEQVALVAAGFGSALRELASAFWPGCLTLVLPRAAALSPMVTGGKDTVAVRMPGHWIPLNLARQLGRPISGTSANRSGQTDLKSIQEIRDTLGGDLDAIVTAGPEPQGMQSTIVDITGNCPLLLREGVVPFANVLRVWEQAAAAETRGLSREV